MKKTKMRPVVYSVIAILVIVLAIRHYHIPDFEIIERGVLYISGQPRGMDYPRLVYRQHIATIVNIRPLSEDLEENWNNEEQMETKSLGVRYFSLPIKSHSFVPPAEVEEAFLALMADSKNYPVLLHGSGDDKRVAMLVALWLCKGKHDSLEDTLKTIAKIIENRPLRPEEMDYIKQLYDTR